MQTNSQVGLRVIFAPTFALRLFKNDSTIIMSALRLLVKMAALNFHLDFASKGLPAYCIWQYMQYHKYPKNVNKL